MDAETREALEASIQHWRENVAAETAAHVKISSDYCALCHRFRILARSICRDCPVKKYTNRPLCSGSPYEAAAKRLRIWKRFPWFPRAKRKFKEAAQAELDFLISLREDKEDD